MVENNKPKTRIISLRLDDEQLKYLEAATARLEEHKPAGMSKVSKTDTIKALIYYGMEIFNQRYGDPQKKG